MAAEQIVGPEPRGASFASSVIRLSCSIAPWPGQLNRYAPYLMTQGFHRWLAVPDVVEPFGGIFVVSRGDGATNLLLHANERDLKVTFKQIWALTIHEEFGHPHVDDNFDLPRLPNNAGAYPLLTVTDSQWLDSFSESRLAPFSQKPTHYQFISMSYIVDVLSFLQPDAMWVAQVSVDGYDAILRGAGA